jgi:hypothetical protein
VVAIAAIALLVHGDEHGCSLQELHLLVLGYEQLRCVLPFRRVLPTRSKVNAEHTATQCDVGGLLLDTVTVRVRTGHSS